MRQIFASLTLLAALGATPSLAQDLPAGDPVKGEKLFNRCKSCHNIAEEKNKVGPHLVGIWDRPMGVVADYSYSAKLKELAAAGQKWDQANLTTYLSSPKDLIPGGKMSFAGIKKPEELQDLLTYLAKTSGKL